MTIRLNLEVKLSTTKDEGLIERALRWWIRDFMIDNSELLSPDDPGVIIGIIEDAVARVPTMASETP